MGAFGVGVFESDVRGDVEELLEEGGKPAVVKAETVPAVSPKASSSKLSPMGRGRKDKGDDIDGDVRFPPERRGIHNEDRDAREAQEVRPGVP